MALRRSHGQRNALLFLTVLPITPMVDISLLMVVFFVLASMTADHRDLPVALPQAGSATTPNGAGVDLAIDRAGVIRIAGRTVTIAEVKTACAKAKRVTIHADTNVRHGAVVAVVDALRLAGVDKVFYATVPPVQDW